MEKVRARNVAQPDEVREFSKGRVDLVNVAGTSVGRATLQPGWKWSECVKPIAGTHSCEAPHFQYQISGVLHVVMDDGSELETRAGDVSMIPPGHDSWVVGNEPVVLVDFQGMTNFAK
ncbi:MAG: cupin domain-containing protein [Armatimonadota bacterium]